MKIPGAETLRISAVAYLRETGSHQEANLLSRCKLEIGATGQRYAGTTVIGLNITLRCRAVDLDSFKDSESGWDLPSAVSVTIKGAVGSVLPTEFQVHELSARSFLVDRNEFEKTELERLIEAQIDLMVAVATGGPRIQAKNAEYKERREDIRAKLQPLGRNDPNPFADLWAWYGRWSSGDLPSYQSRRDYVRNLYGGLLEDLVGGSPPNPAEPIHEPTGWGKVDRTVDRIVTSLPQAGSEEQYQAVGLLCRECIISLAQAVFDLLRHQPKDGPPIGGTDAYRMLEAYFSAEFAGSENEALRRHAKASLTLANALQHKRTARYKDAALCAEATRTVVNIVAITSERL